MIARRTRRMSSSLLPLNITPQITSIHPARPLEKEPSEITRAARGADRAGPAEVDRRSRGPGEAGHRGDPAAESRRALRADAFHRGLRPRAGPPRTFAPRGALVSARRSLVAAQERSTTVDYRARRPIDDLIGEPGRHLDRRVRFANLDSPDVAPGDAGFARDHRDQVRGTDALSRADAGKQADCRPGVLTRRLSRTLARRRTFLRGGAGSLGQPLLLEKLERRRRNLGAVVVLEQRLEGQELARRGARFEERAELFEHARVARPRRRCRLGQAMRLERAIEGERAKAFQLARLNERDTPSRTGDGFKKLFVRRRQVVQDGQRRSGSRQPWRSARPRRRRSRASEADRRPTTGSRPLGRRSARTRDRARRAGDAASAGARPAIRARTPAAIGSWPSGTRVTSRRARRAYRSTSSSTAGVTTDATIVRGVVFGTSAISVSSDADSSRTTSSSAHAMQMARRSASLSALARTRSTSVVGVPATMCGGRIRARRVARGADVAARTRIGRSPMRRALAAITFAAASASAVTTRS